MIFLKKRIYFFDKICTAKGLTLGVHIRTVLFYERLADHAAAVHQNVNAG